jgi:hypothetical protein
MNLSNLKSLFANNGCQKIYIKELSPNDNSKNQIYLGGSFEILNIFPISGVQTESTGEWVRERFKAKINFSWINEDGNIYPAPQSQLILYPKYPEVRFSGFLSRCEKPPSNLLRGRLEGRLLFLSVSSNGTILGFVAPRKSNISKEFFKENIKSILGVFKVIELPQLSNNRQKLLTELKRIHLLDWIDSKRLDKNGVLVECNASNCGGYTLEAELGIRSNGFSEPDYLGWEVKQFGVKKFELLNSSVITLMTPEPTHGFYVEKGVEAFIRKYGYNDLKGIAERMNFGGVHKYSKKHKRTKLEMKLIGFDIESGKIRNAGGSIILIDEQGNETASWSFASLLLHWNRKHNQASYVPSIREKLPNRKYKYGNTVILGTGTDFQFFLSEVAKGNIYYDPGIKMENMSTNPTIKRRSQFRIKSRNLANLYKVNELVTI